jgi:hypothetical protein
MTGAPPTWTILVPTLGERSALFERLMGALLPQLDPYGGRVQVRGWFNNGRPGLPEIRQRMNEGVKTEYLSCVDDDDLVPPYFVDEVMGALGQHPDYVGFLVQCYSDDVPTAVSYHDLTNRGWKNEPDRYLRDISHINPIRSEIARSADYTRARTGEAEDRAWVAQLRHGRKLKTQIMINRIMYHYLYSTSKSAGVGSRWRAPSRITPGGRPAIDHPHFTWSDPDA